MRTFKTTVATALLTMLLFSSCSDFLETKPTDFLSPDNYFTTEKELDAALVGVYDPLGHEAMWGRWMLVNLSYGNDEGLFALNSPNVKMGVYEHDPSEPMINNLWASLYTGIDRANLLLESLEKADVNEEKKNTIRGEALFLRAYYYFLLVDHWGDVPLKLTYTQSANEVNTPRTPAKEIFDLIVDDMTEAESLVLNVEDLGEQASGRISKSTVQGILARVCLTMAGSPLNDRSKYEAALHWTEKLINGGRHELAADYAQIFRNHAQDKYDNKECIWEVEFFGNGIDAYREVSYVGNINGVRSNNTVFPGRSTGTLFPTSILYFAYAEGDLRKDRNIAPYWWDDNTGTKIIRGPSLIYNRYVGKWRRDEETLLPRHVNFTSTNFPLLRYSDVLLMYAEAANEVNGGPTQAAYDALIAVRKRGYGTLYGNIIKAFRIDQQGEGYTSPPTVVIEGGDDIVASATVSGGAVTSVTIAEQPTLTKTGTYFDSPPVIRLEGGGGTGASVSAILTDGTEAAIEQSDDKAVFFELIKEERMRELAFECLRTHDLRRWGIFMQTLKDFGDYITASYPESMKYLAKVGTNLQERHLLFPIPEREMSLNNAITENNPGW